jgi:dienelactone hydrolase
MSWTTLGRAVALAFVVLVWLEASALGQDRKHGPLGSQSGPYREQEFLIAWERAGKTWLSHTKMFRPEGNDPRPLLLINHGAPRSGDDRLRMKPDWADVQARWFAAQGFVVGVPMRRGYGLSDGPVQESYGTCDNANFSAAGLTTANDIQGVIGTLAREPYVDAGRVVVVGQSAGGWGSLGVASRNPTGVVAVINFAGGRGSSNPGINCQPDRLIQAAEQFGKTATIPSIWIYTSNDNFFSADLSRKMFAAYAAGGGPAEYKPMGSFGSDGHYLFNSPSGMVQWTPVVTEFLRAQKLMR